MTEQDIIRSAGGIVLRMTGEKQIEVLLVAGTKNDPNYWGFPKGRQEPGEAIEVTATREIHEETGVYVELLALASVSRYQVRRPDGSLRDKTARLFLARSTGGDFAERSGERLDVRWVPLEAAYQMLTYEDDRMALHQAQQLLENMPLYRSFIAET